MMNSTNVGFNRFIELCEKTEGAIAIHCKAGLGRTGTSFFFSSFFPFFFSSSFLSLLVRSILPLPPF